MSQSQLVIIVIVMIVFVLFMLLAYYANNYSLNRIKSRTVGNGQHGTAKWANRGEIKKAYKTVLFDVDNWRKGENLPSIEGTVVGCKTRHGRTYALVDEGDVHTLMIGAAGVGKTSFFLYPNIEFCCACGMSFVSTDTKGDVARNYATIAKKYYGYNVSVIDLRNPTKSDENNMLYLVNKYMDKYLCDKSNISARSKAEKYAKITAKTIIYAGESSASFGQNAYFYEAAEGLVAAVILLLAEFGERKERHIASVFKLIQELLQPEGKQNRGQQNSGFIRLMKMLPEDHKAKSLAGAAINSADQSMMAVMSTAMSRLNSFIDTELEQMLCFGNTLDAERFCREKSAIFIIFPEEDQSKNFMVSLIIQQLYRELLIIADEKNGRLDRRVMFYVDEFGTMPKIDGAESMFSASRSRRISIVAIIQSFAQLKRNYGEEGSEIITDNTQLTIFGGFAPNSHSAEILSKSLGEQTVMSGSVSHGKDKSQSLQMIARPLLTVDELKTMPKGQFIVMKTGFSPMISPLKLYFKWGIDFEEPYLLPDKCAREVAYMSKESMLREAEIKYPQEKSDIFASEDTPLEMFEETSEELSERRKPKRKKIRIGGKKDELQKVDI